MICIRYKSMMSDQHTGLIWNCIYQLWNVNYSSIIIIQEINFNIKNKLLYIHWDIKLSIWRYGWPMITIVCQTNYNVFPIKTSFHFIEEEKKKRNVHFHNIRHYNSGRPLVILSTHRQACYIDFSVFLWVFFRGFWFFGLWCTTI